MQDLVKFERESLNVNGVKVSVLSAGEGEPLVFWHGAGSWHGWDFAAPWIKRFRVIIPFHPGWGESPDAPHMTTVDDYVLHYLEMFDQLSLKQVNLVGFSMGGRFAATFAIHHRERVRKLVLVAPAGLEVQEYPMANFSQMPPEQILRHLAHDFSVIERRLPKTPDPAFIAERDREGGNFGTLMKNGLVSPWLPRWLHRINMPTLIVWGDQDRVSARRSGRGRKKLIPQAHVLNVPNTGHLVLDESPHASQAIADFL